jgi:2-iminobutanoate/2-iminopropanoate deaminase
VKFHMIAGGPKPVAPFSHAVEADGFVFVTGQMPDTPATPGVLPEGIVVQTRAVMENLRIVLKGLELGFEHIVMARIYLARFKEDYAAMNETYRSYFPPDRLPARTCVGVTGLAYDALMRSIWCAGDPRRASEGRRPMPGRSVVSTIPRV